MPTTDEVRTWRGLQLRGNDDEKLGTIEEIYLDEETGAPEWALVTTGMFGTKQSFVPLRDASRSGDGVSVPFDKATVKDAPKVDPDGRLSQGEEAELYRHYGLRYGERDADAAGTVGRDTSGPTTDDAMTRSEEELRVGTRERESGRVRLRKYVVEENVTQTVPVRREEIRVEREPITDANAGDAVSGPDISSEEHEVVLHEEEVVADKRVVPKERVRLDKDVTTDERQVSETLRKEQLDVDEDAARLSGAQRRAARATGRPPDSAQRFSTTIRVLPSGSRNQNIGGIGSPMRLTSASTSTPPAFRSAWSASTSSVWRAMPVSTLPVGLPGGGGTMASVVAAPAGATSTQR
jgi:uncharacterized protein (TIGR02271 family)